MNNESISSDNRRIAKNTLLLYVRMFVAMGIGLYTSRVILNALGVTDYGVYNVVGGFVSMAGIVTWSMSGAIIRFITLSVGVGDIEKIREVFATASIVQMALSLIVLVIAETVGLWFLHNKLVIPSERTFAAICVYQLSVVSFIVGVLAVPYTAAVTAHEEMGAFALFSIVESVAKLAIVFVVRYSPLDKLILYASLLCLVSWGMRAVYIGYCKRRFEECTFRYRFNKHLFLDMFGFAGWNSISSVTVLLRDQGGNILLNLFGGPVTNAAAGIASTLTSVVSSFTENFTNAFSPQIMKSYAREDYERLNSLLFRFSRLSFYLMFFLALPIFLNAHYLLELWLGIVPEHTVNFVRLVLLTMLTTIVVQPVATAKSAVGNIRNFQITLGFIRLLFIALAYVALRLGVSVEAVYISNISAAIVLLVTHILLVRGDIPGMSLRRFTWDVCCNVALVSLVGSVVPSIVYLNMDESFLRLLVTCIVGCLTAGLSVLYVGCGRGERDFILTGMQSTWKRFVR